MGYYSSVGILIKEKDYNKMFEIAKEKQIKYVLKNPRSKEHINFYKDLTDLLCEYSTINEKINYDDEDYRAIYYDNIKWYSDDLIINFIEEYLRQQEKYQFIRIGESSDDYEEEGTEYYFSIERRISTADGLL